MAMGWVDEKIRRYQAESKLLPALWNDIRDEVRTAVTEFNERVAGASVTLKDCTSNGPYCQRICNGENWMELYLRESSLFAQDATHRRKVCDYRLSDSGKELELTFEKDMHTHAFTSEQASRNALEDFLFTPFPSMFVHSA